MLQGVAGKAFGLDTQLERAAGEEMAREQGHVLAPLAQRRQAHADDIEPVVEVFAEAAFTHAAFEVLVRGRDHAHVRLDRLMAADAVKAAFLQHPQQPRLQVGGHVADLVQKQRSALGLLEAPAALLLRAGKSPALVTEQLRLEQVLGHRSRIDGDERARCARTVAVQRARHQFLAGPGLASDQHRRA